MVDFVFVSSHGRRLDLMAKPEIGRHLQVCLMCQQHWSRRWLLQALEARYAGRSRRWKKDLVFR